MVLPFFLLFKYLAITKAVIDINKYEIIDNNIDIRENNLEIEKNKIINFLLFNLCIVSCSLSNTSPINSYGSNSINHFSIFIFNVF